MAVNGMFDNELILPGVITEIINDYTAGYDTSEFGSTDAVTIIGTAFNGPVGIPVPVYSPEYAKYMFGEAFDSVTRREATLVPEIIDAWNRGCRTIYAVRMSGKDIYKDYELAVESNLKLRVSGQFPCNDNKHCYMLYKSSQAPGNSGVIRIYKPATRTTIREKIEGVVNNLNSILVAEINLAANNISKSSKLIDLLNLINGLNNNNVLTVSIVDENGVTLTDSAKEVQVLSVGDIFPGLYTVGRDAVGEVVNAKTNIEFVRSVDAKPYSSFRENIWKKLVINTDVRQPYPIHADNFVDLKASMKLSMDSEFEFLKKLGVIDKIAEINDIDYEEVELDSFDIYKRLGQGFVKNAKIEKKEKNGKVFYKVIQPEDDDLNKIVGIQDGIYSMLENHKTDYTVVAGLSAETVISGSLPKKEDFKKVEANSIPLRRQEEDEDGNLVDVENIINANVIMDEKDFSRQVDYSIVVENIDENNFLAELLDQENILANLSPIKFARIPVIEMNQLVNKFNDIEDGQLALALDIHDLGVGKLVKFNAKEEKFMTSEETLLCIGSPGEIGYIEPKIIVEIDGELKIFKKEAVMDALGNEIPNSYVKDLNPTLDEHGVEKNFIVTTNGSLSNIYYVQGLNGTNSALLNHAVRVNDGRMLADDHNPLVTGDEHILVFAMDSRSVIPLISLRDLSDGLLEENEFTVAFIETDIPKLPASFSDNRTFINIYSNEITFCSQEEMAQRFNEHTLLKNRFKFELANSINALEELPNLLMGKGKKRADEFIYDTDLYIPYTTTDNFARQLAQHCLYTELKTYPTHGIIGCDRLVGVNLNIVAQKVDDICSCEFDLYAKKNNGNYMLDSDNEPYALGRCLSIVFLQYPVAAGNNYNYTSNGAAGYAGMVSTLAIERSSTNQVIDIDALSFELSNFQLARLNNKGIVCGKNSTAGDVVIVDGITQAPTTSVYRRLSTSKTINVVNRVLRKTIEPYIGLVDSLSTRNALNTAIKSGLSDLKGIIINDFKFKIYTDSSEGNLGIIRIDYVIVPLNEIRQVRNRIEVSDSI